MEYQVKIPILLIVFNRPDSTRVVFDVLREVKPQWLYVAADAPRKNKEGEVNKCVETLAIFDEIDWPCEIFRKINDVNLGSHTTIPQAVDWFFQNEECGIVLEDDCVPSISFFRFCEELLDEYSEENRVMWINGSNIGWKPSRASNNFAFSRFAISWGWASWRRAWHSFGAIRYHIPESKKIEGALKYQFPQSMFRRLYWRTVFNYAYSLRNWDFRWQLAMWISGGVACTPKYNLIRNVGYGRDAVHGGHISDTRANIEASNELIQIDVPSTIKIDEDLDNYLCSSFYRVSIFSVIKMEIARRFPILRPIYKSIKKKFFFK